MTSLNNENLKKIIYFSWILVIGFYTVMGILFSKTHDPLTVFESQLSFNANILRNEYIEIYSAGGMDYYRLAQTLDFGFMLSYGLLFFAIYKRWNLKLKNQYTENNQLNFWNKEFDVFVYVSVFPTLLDIVENIFILKMLNLYPDFPDSWALIHSYCALFKWALLFLLIINYILFRILTKNKFN